MKMIFVLVFLFLVGCGSTEAYKNQLNSYIGITEEDLVQRKGVPLRVFELNDIKYYVYYRGQTYTSPQQGFTNGDFDNYGNFSGHTMTTGGYTYNIFCETTFTIEKGVVTDFRFKGNGCVA